MHNQNIPYNQPSSPKLLVEIQKFDIAFNKSEYPKNHTFTLLGYSQISHEPNNLNYWHVEFTLLDFNKEKITSTGEWVKKYCNQTIKDILVASAYSNHPEVSPISNDFYFKKIA